MERSRTGGSSTYSMSTANVPIITISDDDDVSAIFVDGSLFEIETFPRFHFHDNLSSGTDHLGRTTEKPHLIK